MNWHLFISRGMHPVLFIDRVYRICFKIFPDKFGFPSITKYKRYKGITCHAAIMARELDLPCIVGTKKATDTFKDNETVEIDADKGVVSKLK